MSTSTITVAGMTCGGCASKVRARLSTLDGVSRVDVDPATGRVTVESGREIDPEAIEKAVEAAGYRVVA
ncbi:heavy-metal-associated domain-containing protein [Nocardia sp. CA-290969]|uniref:heavy-metal-associated domain-containing protein n=1 Tax=Nocardia sp. CA-290969 TaxID=3239986 RepID=UPI003D92BE89